MVKVPSNNAAGTVHKNMVIISSGPHNSGEIKRIIIQPKASAG